MLPYSLELIRIIIIDSLYFILENVAQWHFLAIGTLAVLSIQLRLDDIKRSGGDRSYPSSNTSAQIKLQPVIIFLGAYQVLQFLVKDYDQGSKRNIHGVIDWEASIKGYQTFFLQNTPSQGQHFHTSIIRSC